MKAVDIVVHTSIAPEPFGRVIVEGMLARKPVIATRAGGALEIIDEGVTGLLVTPAGTPDSVTCTLPENPFKPVTLTLTGALELPCAMLTVVVERPMVKSGCGGGG